MRKAAWRWNAYSAGAYFTCDRCSQRWRRTSMLTEWDGFKVCPKCLDPRPPQMTPPNAYPEGIPFPDTRPPQDNPDRLMDDSYLFIDGPSVGYPTAGHNPLTGVYPTLPGPATYPNGQQAPIGALSPQNIIVDSVPKAPPSANQLTDDVTLKTGVIFPATSTGDPGTVPGSPQDPPQPPFYTP